MGKKIEKKTFEESVNGLKTYLIIDHNNKFFVSRYRGFNEDIKYAKVYTKSGSARRQITDFYKYMNQYGYIDGILPRIVEISAGGFEILDETNRVIESDKNRKLEKLEIAKRNAECKMNQTMMQYEEAKRQYDQFVKS